MYERHAEALIAIYTRLSDAGARLAYAAPAPMAAGMLTVTGLASACRCMTPESQSAVLAAIRADLATTERQRQMLIDIYTSFRKGRQV